MPPGKVAVKPRSLLWVTMAAAALAGCTEGPVIPPDQCRIAPVRGFQFQDCSNTVVNLPQSGPLKKHSLHFVDAQSEMWLLYFRGEGQSRIPGFPVEATVDFFGSADMFGSYLVPASQFSRVTVDRGERFFDFRMGGRWCKGFTRFSANGNAREGWDAVALLLMCRAGTVPISIREARFFTDQISFY